MDGLVQMIVDILRRKEEGAALNRGGPTAGGVRPQAPPVRLPSPDPFVLQGAQAPKHGGKTIEQIIAEQGG